MKNLIIFTLSLCLMSVGLVFGSKASEVDKKQLLEISKITKGENSAVVAINILSLRETSPGDHVKLLSFDVIAFTSNKADILKNEHGFSFRQGISNRQINCHQNSKNFRTNYKPNLCKAKFIYRGQKPISV